MNEHNMWLDGRVARDQRRELLVQYRARASRQNGAALASLGQVRNHRTDAHSGSTSLCKTEMETRFGVKLPRTLVDRGNMKIIR